MARRFLTRLTAGVALERARSAKKDVYPELLESSRLRLLVAAIEVGGRMNSATMKLLSDLSFYRARSEPQALQSSIARIWRSRWTTMLSVVCQDVLAATFVDDGIDFLDAVGTGAPLGVDVWLDDP